jgi:DNA repair protein RecN (Recombination protein N)
MLESLTVRNFALIESLFVEFGPRLNVLSGETGAGKSIIVGALGLLFGAKAQATDIRAGADEAEVSAVVRVGPSSSVREWLAERALPLQDDDELIIRRVVRQSGRSACFIQASPVQAGQLAELASHLFDLHGQHEHQSLLRPDQQRVLLDRYGGLQDDVAIVATLYRELVQLRDRTAGIAKDDKERARQAELLEYAIAEIDAAGLISGEDEELALERQRLTNFERISATASDVYENTAEARGGALAMLRRTLDGLRQLAALDDVFARQIEQAESAFYELEDVAEGVRQYQAALAFDPDRLQAIGDRLEVIRSLSRKYGDSVPQVLAYADEARDELAGLDSAEADLQRFGERSAEVERELKQRAARLSQQRSTVATELQQRIEVELHDLGMPKVRVEVHVVGRQREGRQVLTNSGADDVEFQIAPNVGEPMQPLRAIASGGEVSRVMLALKTVFAESDVVDTLIFDEVDAGIGGNIALQVGNKLQRIGEQRQILCITHLATVAAHADNHLLVEKRETGSRTITTVTEVAGDERVAELARMLAGDEDADISRRHAAELLERRGPQVGSSLGVERETSQKSR